MRYVSSYHTDREILIAMSDIHLKGQWYEADITYSKGAFYKDLPKPVLRSDMQPLLQDVIQADSRYLHHMEDDSISSIIFDPPFLFRNRKAENFDKLSARFSYFPSFDALTSMYGDTLCETMQKLKRGGYLFMKCQDMTDGRFYCTHNYVINMAVRQGFELKDIFIKVSRTKLQADAKQQNCAAKIHSYWLVLKKPFCRANKKREGGEMYERR